MFLVIFWHLSCNSQIFTWLFHRDYTTSFVFWPDSTPSSCSQQWGLENDTARKRLDSIKLKKKKKKPSVIFHPWWENLSLTAHCLRDETKNVMIGLALTIRIASLYIYGPIQIGDHIYSTCYIKYRTFIHAILVLLKLRLWSFHWGYWKEDYCNDLVLQG